MLERLAMEASTFAGSINALILLIAVVVGFWWLLAEGALFWLIFRFRQRKGSPTQYITGEEKHLKRWISIPHLLVIVCDLFLIVAAVRVWMNVKQTMPPTDQTVRIISQQWAWSFVLPGADGALDTADDVRTVDELRVQANTTYRFELQSRDVLHSFSVPAFRLKQDAIPGRTIAGWFRSERPGAYDIQCAEICGMGHGLMAARIIVEPEPSGAGASVRTRAPETAAEAGRSHAPGKSPSRVPGTALARAAVRP